MKLLVAIAVGIFLFTAPAHGQDSGLKGGAIPQPVETAEELQDPISRLLKAGDTCHLIPEHS